MNFKFNEEQRMLRNAVREFAEKEIMPYGINMMKRRSTLGIFLERLLN